MVSHSLSFKVLDGLLRKTTEYLAREITHPSPDGPKWNDTEWRIAKAVLSLQGMSVPLADVSRWQGPDHWQEFLHAQREQTLFRHERIAGLLIELDTAAQRENIAFVALKGVALCRLGVYRAGDRPMGDIDLLVRVEDARVAKKIIGASSYVPALENARHAAFEPEVSKAPVALGEHVDNPIKIELHTKISEFLPVAEVDITAAEFPCNAKPGLNAYPSLASLMRHLLLHAANNIRARALRQIQLHDIALLAARMTAADWDELLCGSNQRGLWWALSPLTLTTLYYPQSIPARAITAAHAGCPRWLQRAVSRQRLSDVSWSNLRIQAFPGIEWSKSLSEVLAFARSRIAPTQTELSGIKYTAATQDWARQIPWYGQSHLRRIARWMFTRPPRVQTMYSIQAALES